MWHERKFRKSVLVNCVGVVVTLGTFAELGEVNLTNRRDMCLLIGCSGVGKTLLLKRLNTCSNRGSYNNIGDPPATIPTVGTNLVTVITGRKAQVTIRELGGSMAPIWPNYYKECNALLFMIDLSNRTQVSASWIQLLYILTHEHLQTAAVLIILNKVDVPDVMSKDEYLALTRLEETMMHAKQKIQLLEVSAREGQGLEEVAKWIQEHSKPASGS